MPTISGVTPGLCSRLARSASYQDFLQLYFRETGISYAEVARRSGFSSRSYPRDVTENRRRLTAKSLPILTRGLRLSAELNRVFQLLYFSAYPEENAEGLSAAALQTRLEKTRQQAARKLKSPTRKKLAPPSLLVFQETEVEALAAGLSDVVAALGEHTEGATLDSIQKRTGLRKTFLAEKLDLLVRHGIIEYRGDSRRYLSRAEHVDWTGQTGSRLAKAAFQSSVSRLAYVAQNHFARPDTMLLSSALSVAKKDIPRLKQELREVMMKFVDRSLESETEQDTVVQVITGLFESRLAMPGPEESLLDS
jgi:uncharacterized protein (TIGR02147 family)